MLCARCIIDGSNALLEALRAERAEGHAFPPPRPTVRGIVRAAAILTGIPVPEILGERRFRPEVRVRQAIVWVAVRATGQSSVAIGRALGGRDHSTIIHARDAAEEIYKRDAGFAWICERLWTAAETEPLGPTVAPIEGPVPAPAPATSLKPLRQPVRVRREPGEYAPRHALPLIEDVPPAEDEGARDVRTSFEVGSRALLAALRRNYPERFAACA